MKELTVPASTEHLDEVTDFVNACLEELDCPMKVQIQIDIAIDELFSNIAYYAYGPEGGNATVSISAEDDHSAVHISFLDSGVAYDPLSAEEPDVTLNAEDRKIGGLGIFMVRKSMDDITYRREDGKNILTITKKL